MNFVNKGRFKATLSAIPLLARTDLRRIKYPSFLLAILLTLFPRSLLAETIELLPELPATLRQGGRIAFTYQAPIEQAQQKEMSSSSDIYVIDFAVRSVAPLVSTKEDDEFPSWSPDGAHYAFYSDISGDREIWVADVSGIVKQITKSPGVDEDPDWSPDGANIVFRSEREKGSNIFTSVFTTDTNPNKIPGTEKPVKALTTGRAKRSVPRWSPKGDSLIFSTNENWPGWDIMLLDLKSGQQTAQTSGIRTNCHAAWRPDGEAFLYSHGGGSKVNQWMLVLGEDPVQLTNFEGRDYDGVWISQEEILFVRETHPDKNDYQLFYLHTKLKVEQQITKNSGSIRDLSWTRHSKTPLTAVRSEAFSW